MGDINTKMLNRLAIGVTSTARRHVVDTLVAVVRWHQDCEDLSGLRTAVGHAVMAGLPDSDSADMEELQDIADTAVWLTRNGYKDNPRGAIELAMDVDDAMEENIREGRLTP